VPAAGDVILDRAATGIRGSWRAPGRGARLGNILSIQNRSAGI
jgi:hypothetical protein